MAGKKNALAAFEKNLEESRRQRNEKLAQEMLGHDPKKLAQEFLGRKGRTPTPKSGTPTQNSLASRVGVNKRSNSLPRTHNPPTGPRNPRQASALSRSITDDGLSKPRRGPKPHPKATTTPDLSIRGAASGPYILRAQNFAPGTTAADIESVMSTEGGQVVYCQLISQHPTVIAEIGFVEKASADKIIEKFNNKRADGQLLYVYYAKDGGAVATAALDLAAPAAAPAVPAIEPVDETMEVDENAEAREAQNKLREERRGRDDRNPREAFQRQDERYDDYRRGPRQAAPDFQDGRYGFDGYGGAPGPGPGGPSYGGRGGGPRYGGGRMYSDGGRYGGPRNYRS